MAEFSNSHSYLSFGARPFDAGPTLILANADDRIAALEWSAKLVWIGDYSAPAAPAAIRPLALIALQAVNRLAVI